MADVFCSRLHICLISVAGLGLLLAAGCSRAPEGPLRVAVSGTVSLDGVPVERGTINLIPAAAGSSLRKASALVTDGGFDIPAAKGPNVGSYTVELRWLKPTGRKIPGFADIGEDMIEETVEAIPARYNVKSTLVIELTTGPNIHDFRLKSN